MKIISLILSFLLLAVQPVSAVVMVGFGQSGGDGTLGVIVDNITDRTPDANGQISTNMMRGNSFSYTSGSGTYDAYSVSVVINSIGGANTIECRLGSAANLDTYLAIGTLTVSTAGEKEIVFSSNPTLSDGTIYYFACATTSATPSVFLQYNAASTYSGGQRLYGTSWAAVAPTADGDMLFKVSAYE